MSETAPKLTERVSVKISKRELEEIKEVCRARGESISLFFRRAAPRQLRALGFGSDFQKRALGLRDLTREVENERTQDMMKR